LGKHFTSNRLECRHYTIPKDSRLEFLSRFYSFSAGSDIIVKEATSASFQLPSRHSRGSSQLIRLEVTYTVKTMSLNSLRSTKSISCSYRADWCSGRSRLVFEIYPVRIFAELSTIPTEVLRGFLQTFRILIIPAYLQFVIIVPSYSSLNNVCIRKGTVI
jgi:hypothetical protein